MTETLAIIGAGHASGQLIASLRQLGYGGRIRLFGDETSLPYQRPPLSKKYLSGELAAERLLVKPAAFYDTADVELALGRAVTGVDLRARTLTLDDGSVHAWDRLVFGTGSRVRRLDCPGSTLEGIHYLRTITDVDAIRASLVDAARIGIVGAGYIGLETAAVLRELGHEVTVFEAADRVMSRVVSPEISAFFDSLHRERGVDLRLDTMVRGFSGDEGRVTAIETGDDERLPVDLVVVGIGILPNDELAAAAGLQTDDGIVVDEFCRCSEADVFAMGDCTRHPNAIYDRSLRLESVHNALEQAKTIATTITGNPVPYRQVPWFWSDQYEFKLQIAGLLDGHDEVLLRGDPASGSFACVYLADGRMIAIDCVNNPRDFMQAKMMLADLPRFDRAALADCQQGFRDMPVTADR